MCRDELSLRIRGFLLERWVLRFMEVCNKISGGGTDKLGQHDKGPSLDVRSRSAQPAVSPSMHVYTLPPGHVY